MAEARIRNALTRRSVIGRGAAIWGSAIVAMGLAPAAAVAKDSPGDSLLKKVQDRGKVIVGTGSTNPPWHFEDENGKLVGFDIQMGRILARGLFQGDPDKVEFVVHEADSRIPDLLADKVDINFQFMTISAGRALQVEFSVPYYREGTTLLLLKDSPYNSTEGMAGKKPKIAILQNVGAEDTVHGGVPDAEVQQFDSVASSIEALKSGRVDGTALDLSTGQWLSAREPGTYKVTPEAWNQLSYGASVKPGDQIWLNFVNTVLREAMVGRDFALYRTAFKTYFGAELPTPPLGFPVEFK